MRLARSLIVADCCSVCLLLLFACLLRVVVSLFVPLLCLLLVYLLACLRVCWLVCCFVVCLWRSGDLELVMCVFCTCCCDSVSFCGFVVFCVSVVFCLLVGLMCSGVCLLRLLLLFVECLVVGVLLACCLCVCR